MEQLLERVLGRPLFAGENGNGAAAPEPQSAPTAEQPVSSGTETDEPPPPEEEFEVDVPGEPVAAAQETPAVEVAPEPVDDGTEEFDLNGKKLKVPREVRPLLMMQEDYTRKTQALAEKERVLADHFEQQAAASQERITKAGQLANAENMIRRYQTEIDWPTLIAQDPQTAQLRQSELSAWQFTKENILRDLGSLQAQEAQARQSMVLEADRQMAARIQENQAILHRDIPNWKETGPKVGEYAIRELGFTQQELGGIPDARFVKALHAAYLGSQLLQKQKTAAQQRTQQPKAAAETITPLATVTPKSGGPSARVSLEKATPEQYIAIRKRQLEAKEKAH